MNRSLSDVELYQADGTYDTKIDLRSGTYIGITWNPTAQRYAVVNRSSQFVELYHSDGTYEVKLGYQNNATYNGITWNPTAQRYAVVNVTVRDVELYRSKPADPTGISDDPFLLMSNLVFGTVNSATATIYYYYGVLLVIGFNSSGIIVGHAVQNGGLTYTANISGASKLAYLYIPKV